MLRKLYETEYYSHEARVLESDTADEERLVWAKHNLTKALELQIEGVLLDTMMSLSQSHEISSHTQGFCQGLFYMLDKIEEVKRGVGKDD